MNRSRCLHYTQGSCQFLSAGTRNHLNLASSETQIQSVMALVRQLYYGAGRAIAAARGTDEPPKSPKNFLSHLSTTPEWFSRWKISCCRKGAMHTLALAKSHYLVIDPTKLAKGFPEFNLDGTRFDDKSYAQIDKLIRYPATMIAEGLRLDTFQHGFDKKARQVLSPEPEPAIVVPPKLPEPVAASTVAGSGTPAMPPPSRPSVDDNDIVGYKLSAICWQSKPSIASTGEGSSKAKSKEAPKTQKSTEVVSNPAEASKGNPASQTKETTSFVPETELAAVPSTEPTVDDPAKAPASTPVPEQ